MLYEVITRVRPVRRVVSHEGRPADSGSHVRRENLGQPLRKGPRADVFRRKPHLRLGLPAPVGEQAAEIGGSEGAPAGGPGGYREVGVTC